jgi:hypothetical protein
MWMLLDVLAAFTIRAHRPDDGGSKYLWNVGKLLPDYTVLQPRRQQSSYSPPWEPQILLSHLHIWLVGNRLTSYILSFYGCFLFGNMW